MMWFIFFDNDLILLILFDLLQISHHVFQRAVKGSKKNKINKNEYGTFINNTKHKWPHTPQIHIPMLFFQTLQLGLKFSVRENKPTKISSLSQLNYARANLSKIGCQHFACLILKVNHDLHSARRRRQYSIDHIGSWSFSLHCFSSINKNMRCLFKAKKIAYLSN